MFKFVLLSLLLMLTDIYAESQVSEPEPVAETEKPIVRILSFRSEQNVDGSYKFEYESEDGSKRSEQGYYKETDKNEEGKAQVMEGSYSYKDPNGELVNIAYVADEKGFRPQGNIIHPAISSYLKKLELETKPPTENVETAEEV